MFRHYRVILRELVVITLPGYTSMSNAEVGNIIKTLTEDLFTFERNSDSPMII
jgi:hypothetical protein